MVIKNFCGTEIRTIFGLKSANFTVSKEENIKFNVIGYGHGVRTYVDILRHFYSNTDVLTLE